MIIINDIQYTDVTVLIALSEKNLPKLVTNAEEKSLNEGMTLNEKKNNCMLITKEEAMQRCNEVIGGKPQQNYLALL